MNEDIIFYAFRYALGRKTYASRIVSDFIIENWKELSGGMKKTFIEEIQEAISEKRAGMKLDEDLWKRILILHEATEVKFGEKR